MSPTPRAVVEALYARFLDRDVQGILDLLHPDIDWIVHLPNPPLESGGPRRGHIEVTECFIAMGKAGIFNEYALDAVIVDGDTVVVRGHEHVTHKQTNQSWSRPWVHWWTVQEGLATRFEAFVDSATILDAAGE